MLVLEILEVHWFAMASKQALFHMEVPNVMIQYFQMSVQRFTTTETGLLIMFALMLIFVRLVQQHPVPQRL